MLSPLKVAVLIEDGASVCTLGDPVELSFIDVMGLPTIHVSAWVIDGGEFGAVLVTRSEVERMAIAVAAAQITGAEESASAAREIWQTAPAYRAMTNAEWAGLARPSAGVPLFDVTDLFGGWENVAPAIVPAGVNEGGPEQLLELVIAAIETERSARILDRGESF